MSDPETWVTEGAACLGHNVRYQAELSRCFHARRISCRCGLDGFQPADGHGWDDGYNFGSRQAVLARWKAALAAGVNFIATDQYEDPAAVMKPPNAR